MMEFKCANCKKVIQFNEKDPISLRCNSCGSGEIIFQNRIIRQCIVCKAEEVVEPGVKTLGRHDCWGRGYVWIVKEKAPAVKDVPSLEAAKQSFMDKVRTIINPKEKVADTLNEAGNLKDLEAKKDEEAADEPGEQEEPAFDDLKEPGIKEEAAKLPLAEKPKKEKPKKAATPFKRRGRG